MLESCILDLMIKCDFVATAMNMWALKEGLSDNNLKFKDISLATASKWGWIIRSSLGPLNKGCYIQNVFGKKTMNENMLSKHEYLQWTVTLT